MEEFDRQGAVLDTIACDGLGRVVIDAAEGALVGARLRQEGIQSPAQVGLEPDA